MSSSTSNTSPRQPRGYSRATSEADANHRLRQQSGNNQRLLFERHWSTSVLQAGEQNRVSLSDRNAASAEFSLGASWSSGFGDFGTHGDLAAFAESWTSGLGETPRDGSTTADGGGPLLPVNPPIHRTLSSETEKSTRSSSHHTTQTDPETGEDVVVSSAIHDAARILDYAKVKDNCVKNPRDAQFVGPVGWTALHHVCNRRCPDAEVYRACIQAYPEALLLEDAKGMTPLHHACRNKAPREAVDLLLHLFPEIGKLSASKPDRQRRSPLWYAVRYDAPAGVVPMLLEVDPSVVLSDDQHSESPLAKVWDSFAEELEGSRTLHPYLKPEENEETKKYGSTPDALWQRLQCQPELLKRWKWANMFLKAAFGFRLSEEEELNDAGDRKWRILHATSAIKCHPTLFGMARALHPEQAHELDENDLYPLGLYGNPGSSIRQHQTALHLAASSNATGYAGRTVITELLKLNPGAARMPDGIDGSYPLHRIVENQHKRHWTVDGVNPLYMINPSAVVQPDQNGKLPLHRAAAAIVHQESSTDLRTRSVICNLVNVYPTAASVNDSAGCLPLHLIAKNASEWNEEVAAVYEAHHDAISARTGRECNNSLPLHLASANPVASRSLIQRLVELNPRGASQSDGQGKLPLHLACEQGKPWFEGGVEAVYEAFPQAVRTREDNERHWLALHMAAASHASCGDLIHQLVDSNPQSCYVADSQGRYPLHLACESGKNWEGGLEAIFEGNPLAINSTDNQGRLPFFIAAIRCSLSSVSAVPETRSEDSSAASEVDAIASSKRKPGDELDILFNLLRSDPSVLPHRS